RRDERDLADHRDHPAVAERVRRERQRGSPGDPAAALDASESDVLLREDAYADSAGHQLPELARVEDERGAEARGVVSGAKAGRDLPEIDHPRIVVPPAVREAGAAVADLVVERRSPPRTLPESQARVDALEPIARPRIVRRIPADAPEHHVGALQGREAHRDERLIGG